MTLCPTPSTPYIVPHYLGGPLDGGCGPIEPTHDALGSIRHRGGSYQLQGFQHSSEFVADVTLAMVTPDRAIYQWEPAT